MGKTRKNKTKMSKEYTKLDALKYLVNTEYGIINEWTEAAMCHFLSKVIKEDDNKIYAKEELDRFLKYVSNA